MFAHVSMPQLRPLRPSCTQATRSAVAVKNSRTNEDYLRPYQIELDLCDGV